MGVKYKIQTWMKCISLKKKHDWKFEGISSPVPELHNVE